jgi:hypothetical protein
VKPAIMAQRHDESRRTSGSRCLIWPAMKCKPLSQAASSPPAKAVMQYRNCSPMEDCDEFRQAADQARLFAASRHSQTEQRSCEVCR